MQQKIEINIGGIKYQLSRNICEKIPRVSEYINDNKYFIDRDGKLFGYLLHLVLEKDIDIDNISTNKMMLEKLNTEATWYGLKNISENILQYMEKVGHDISLIRFMDSVYDVANNEDNILDIEKLAGIRKEAAKEAISAWEKCQERSRDYI